VSDWEFYEFWDRYNEWVDRDEPDYDKRFWVIRWIYELDVEPTYSATVQPQVNGWMARVPNAEDEFWCVVGLFTIDETTGVVRCSSIITLPKPELDEGT
jgi:hypothetical protein